MYFQNVYGNKGSCDKRSLTSQLVYQCDKFKNTHTQNLDFINEALEDI